MATLDKYIAEATKSYEGSRNALQSQLDALSGQLAETEANINKQFAIQQQNLDDQRQTAASNASMQAAGSGGSFGGKANIANRDYYQQVFVPAVTQLQTNQAQALSEARQRSENQRMSLNYQIAQLADQAYTNALSRYDNWEQFDRNLAWDKDKFGQQMIENRRQFDTNMAWDKDKFGQQLAWDKDKFAQQLADSAKNRAAARSSGSTASVGSGYWPQNDNNGVDISNYYKKQAPIIGGSLGVSSKTLSQLAKQLSSK